MAAVFDIDHGFRSRAVASVDTGLEIIEIAVSTLGPTDAVAQLQRAQRRLASFETRVLAEHITSDGNTRQAEKLLRDSK
jgi:2-keto-3-deoxy-6-phosphogluconate aldolase